MMKSILVVTAFVLGICFASAQSINFAEYFFDADPGVGSGIALTLDSNTGQLTQSFTIPTAGLVEGFHSFYIRTRTSAGVWGLYDRTSFFVTSVSSITRPIIAAEFFFDQDPGVGNGTALALNTNTGQLTQSFAIPTTGLSVGFHDFHVRTRNTEGNWSLYDRTVLYINASSPADEPIIAAEFFFDTDPGVGLASPLTVDVNTGQLVQSFVVPTTGLTEGIHGFHIRVQKENGNWSLYDRQNITISVNAIDNTVTQDGTTLTANFEAAGAIYQWLNCDTGSTPIPGETNSVFEVTESGNYAVQITLDDQSVVSACIQVSVDATSDDNDNDGVLNADDLCPGTQEGAVVDVDGCAIFTLASNNFQILTIGESCINNNNGMVQIDADATLDYTAVLEGNGDTVLLTQQFTSTIAFTDLSAGNYTLCITVNGQPDYENCLEVVIVEPEALSVNSKASALRKELTLSLAGGINYTITLNGSTFSTTDTEITLPLTKAENTLEVRTDRDCQGIHSETIFLNSEAYVYPNPSSGGDITVLIGNQVDIQDTMVGLSLFALDGTIILDQDYPIVNGQVVFNVDTLPIGVYLLNVKTGATLSTHKIIRR